MIRSFSMFSAIVVVALALSGCGGGKDEARPVKGDAKSAYDLAFRKYNKGYINEAVAMYKRALELDPNLSKAHFDLGIIYDDYLKDKDKAIYHYSMYLKREPDTEKASMVREWIEKVRGEAKMVASGPTPTAEVVREEAEEYADSREKIKSLELEIKAYLATIDELRKEVKRLTALQSGDLEGGPSPAGEKGSLERKYEKEKIGLLEKFEREKDKLRAQQERANARIRVLEAKVRTYEARLKKSTKSTASATSRKSATTARQPKSRRVPTPAKKPAQIDQRRGVTIPAL